MQTVGAVIGISCTWIVVAALLIGNGALVQRLIPEQPARDRAWSALWAGFVAVLAVLQVWHLFLAVGGVAFALFAAVGAYGLLKERRPLLAAASRSRSSGRAVLYLVPLVWLADRALGPPVGDSLLYHLQAIRWIREYPAVPGLANLYYRLGFNNSNMLWSSLLDVGPWAGRVSHVAVGVLIAAWVVRSIAGAARWAAGDGTRADVFSAFVLAPLIGHAVTLGELRLSTSDPDTFCGLLVLASIERFLAATADDPAGAAAGDGSSRGSLLLSVALAAASAATKAPGLAFAASLPVACVLWARRAGGPAVARALAWRAGAVAAIVLVPWAVRGIVLSGYPLYPLSILRFPVDWAPAREQVDLVRQLVRTHHMPPVAEQLAAELGSPALGWMAWQLTRCPELILLPCGLALLSGVLIARRSGHEPSPGPLLAIAALLPAIAVWAALAPAPRFGYGLVWAAAAALAGAAFVGAERRRLGLALAVALALVPAVHRTVAWAAAGRPDRSLGTWLIGGGLREPNAPSLRTVTIQPGLSVQLPENGAIDNAPLLGTDLLFEGLESRRPGEIRAGFRIR